MEIFIKSPFIFLKKRINFKNGFQNVFYVRDIKVDGMDNEVTVDGVHFTDLVFLRYANYII